MCFSANIARSLTKRAHCLSLDNIFHHISAACNNGNNNVSILSDADTKINDNDRNTLKKLGYNIYMISATQWVSYSKIIIEW